MIDIVLPKKNEEEFINTAIMLGYSELCFLYPYGDIKEKIRRDVIVKKFGSLCDKFKSVKFYLGAFTDLDGSKKKLLPKQFDIFVGKVKKNLRPYLEKSPIDIFIGHEVHNRKDFIHHRNSGINQVLCKIAAQNKKIMCMSHQDMLKDINKNCKNSTLIGRLRQNIRLYRKYKIMTAFATFSKNPVNMRNPKDLISVLEILGLQSRDAKNCLFTIAKFLKEKRKEKSKDFVSSGILQV